MSDSSQMNTICEALHGYYQRFGKGDQYVNQDGIGKFTQYCDDNGIEDIEEELAVGSEECLLCEFDEDFPFIEEPEDDAAKREHIYDLLMNPETMASGYPLFTKELFEEQPNYDEIRKLYKAQCPVIYNKGAEEDTCLLRLWGIQQKYQFPYLQHLIDSYDRYRVQHPDESISHQDWCRLGENTHFRIPSIRNAQISIGGPPQLLTNFIGHSMAAAATRVSPKLIIPNMIRINDSLQIITRYIHGATKFISGLLKTAKLEKGKQSLFPFQIDLCIFLGRTVSTMSHNINVDEKDPDDDDEDEIHENNQYAQPVIKRDGGVDHVGDIKSKLKANDLKFVHKTLKSDPSDDNEFMMREFRNLFLEFHGQKNKPKEQILKCLHEKRIIAFVDRRHPDPERDDEIYFAEAPAGDKTRDIPRNAVPEWGISAAKTCILPSLKRYNENVAVGDVQAEDLDEKMKDDKDVIIGVDYAAGKMLTISFQAKSEREIKAYLFWNQQTIRFFGDDVRNVLPSLFVENEPNKQCVRNNQFVNEMIEEINKVIVDTEFAKWLSTYPCTKNKE